MSRRSYRMIVPYFYDDETWEYVDLNDGWDWETFKRRGRRLIYEREFRRYRKNHPSRKTRRRLRRKARMTPAQRKAEEDCKIHVKVNGPVFEEWEQLKEIEEDYEFSVY